MRHAIPVSVLIDPMAPLEGDLIAEVFWATSDGELAREVGRLPVQNGVALYDGAPLEDGLFWAIRIREANTGGVAFRSGPLRRLPGPSPGVSVPAGELSIARTRASWSLDGLEGVPERVTSQLATLAAPLQFHAAGLSADSDRNYVVTVIGRLEANFGDLPFSYRRPLHLVASVDPGRPRPPVLAEPAGMARIGGADMRPFAATLDSAIKEAVEAQLDASMSAMTFVRLVHIGAGFQATTVSVSALSIGPPHTGPDVTVTWWGGAITGELVAPPIGPVGDDADSASASSPG